MRNKPPHGAINAMDMQNVSILFAGLSSFAAVVTAIIAAWSLIGSRQDSHDRTRPVIVVRLVRGPSFTNLKTVYLTVENRGQSLAKGIELTFNPPLPEYEKTTDGLPGIVAPILRKRYANSILMLTPGEQLKKCVLLFASGCSWEFRTNA